MKKVFLTFVFVLATTFSFASSNITNNQFEEIRDSAMVTTSCGATGMIMFNSVEEAIALALDMEEWLCG